MWGIVYILHDHIVGGDAITRNEEEGLIVNFIEVADLASGDKGQGTLQICGGQSFSHCEIVQLVSCGGKWLCVIFFFPSAVPHCSLAASGVDQLSPTRAPLEQYR